MAGRKVEDSRNAAGSMKWAVSCCFSSLLRLEQQAINRETNCFFIINHFISTGGREDTRAGLNMEILPQSVSRCDMSNLAGRNSGPRCSRGIEAIG